MAPRRATRKFHQTMTGVIIKVGSIQASHIGLVSTFCLNQDLQDFGMFRMTVIHRANPSILRTLIQTGPFHFPGWVK